MSAKKTIVLLAAGVALGVIATPAPDAPKPEVQFKIIHGPTKFITKKVPEKIVHEPPVVMDWPESCNNALTYMKSGSNSANGVYKEARIYFEYMNKVQISQLDNPISVSNVANWMADHKEKVRVNMQNLVTDTESLDVAIQGCEKAMAKAEEDAKNAAAGAR